VNPITSYIYNIPGGPLTSIYEQQTNSSVTTNLLLHKTDFTNPFTTKSKLEAGGRVAIMNTRILNKFYKVDSEVNLIYQSLLSSYYNYHD
jgi:hypothetical protein